jgi:hypothetical protein
VVQKDNFSPIEHYDTLGYVIVCISLFSIYFVYRVSKLIKKSTEHSHNNFVVNAQTIDTT